MSKRAIARTPEAEIPFLQAPELTGEEPWLNMPSEDLRWDDITIPDHGLAIAILTLRSLPYAEYLRTAHWAGIRRRAMRRHNGQCLCAKNASDAHHTSYQRKGFERPGDVVALCRACHAEWHRTWSLQIRESLKQSA